MKPGFFDFDLKGLGFSRAVKSLEGIGL